MSEPELAYMTGTDEDFDLPRWQTQTHLEPLSSSSQAAQTATQTSYLYSNAPPPPPPQSTATNSGQRPALIQQSPAGASRGARISQILEQDQPLANQPSQYLSGGQNNQLARSSSLGGGNPSSSRGRRHHQPEDLEGAFSSDTQGNSRQHNTSASQNSFYPTNVSYQQTSPNTNNGMPSGGDSYPDMYFNGGSGTKRTQAAHDTTTSTRPPRSPMRRDNTPLLDPYSQQQSQYSPTANSYQYGTSPDHQRTTPGYHSRNHSQIKTEPISPPVASAYSPVQQHSSSNSGYPSSPYSMESTSPHPASTQSHLSALSGARQNSLSTPNTPLSYGHSLNSSQYYPQDQQMVVEMPVTQSAKHRRESGFRRVRDARDLRPYINPQPAGRRMDSTGVFLSPLRQLTTNIIETYHICNPQFRYESTHNPRRVLTKPSKPAHNEGYDNDDYDYILYVNDWLGTEDGHKYLILDILGQGTFGQVVKCQNMKTHEIVAVKVVKNKPAYFNQSMMEVTILELLNNNCDPQDEHHILRLRDSFIHRNHLCLVFELLSSNLYELIKQNQFQGLSTQLVKVFTAQLLDALTVLKDARLIHCDLKPENILLKSLQSPQIKVIDFGSACHERQTVYTYIQSRFYRSPEVLLGIPYNASIDMWSLGCIAVELFLGLPLFPGTSEYNQITRIVEMLGMPPSYMLDMGKQSNQFFDSYVDMYGQKKYRLKSLEQYSREHNTNEQPGKQYFKATSLPEIIKNAPMPTFKSSSSRQGHEMEKELNNRASFIDFCQGLLNLNPIERWTPQQARMHPFITGEKFTKPFIPVGQITSTVTPSNSSSSGSTADPKRPYGGLVPSQPKGTRAYQDAASYNQHLAQHQAYTAQAQASQAATFRNPYIAQQNAQQSTTTTYSGSQEPSNPSYNSQPPQSQYPAAQAATGAHGSNQSTSGQLAVNTAVSQYPSHPSVPSHHPNPPSNSYYPSSRARANTINQMDAVPPALARLQHMNQDVISGRNALTPVLNRDDAMREWERRQSGKATAAQPYPQLEFLQQQAEMAAASGLTGWPQPTSNRYPPPPSKLAQSYHPQTIIVDEDNNSRRDAVMSNVRSAARSDPPANLYGTSAAAISSPPQAYSTNAPSSGNRFAATYAPQQQSQQQTTSPFDSIDRRTDIGTLFVPMQPDQYQPYVGSNAPSSSHPQPAASSRLVAQPPQAAAPSFYGAGVVSAGQQSTASQQRNLFAGNESSQQGQMGTKDNRRGNTMDVWPR